MDSEREVEVPTCTSQHNTTAAIVDGVLGGDDTNVDSPLFPKSVVSYEILHLVQSLAEFSDELIDIVQEPDGDILVDPARPHVRCVHSGKLKS